MYTEGFNKVVDEFFRLPEDPSNKARLESLLPGSVLWIAPHFIDIFITNFWKYIRNPIILITNHSDVGIPDSFPMELRPIFQKCIEDPNLLHWFSQNMTYDHPKCTRIPIGLDYHSLGKAHMDEEVLIQTIRGSAPDWKSRQPLVYCNWTTNIDRGDRQEALCCIDADIHVVEPSSISREETFKRQTKYCFVSSPQGNGLDCHRTWEALLLGCVPIVKDSSSLYDGLPVWSVNDWSDITSAAVQLKKEEFAQRLGEFSSEKLFMNYWLNLILSKKPKHSS